MSDYPAVIAAIVEEYPGSHIMFGEEGEKETTVVFTGPAKRIAFVEHYTELLTGKGWVLEDEVYGSAHNLYFAPKDESDNRRLMVCVTPLGEISSVSISLMTT